MGDLELIKQARDEVTFLKGVVFSVGDADWTRVLVGELADRLEALSALRPQAGDREGWRWVPVEPTREMWAAAGDAFVKLDRRKRALANHDKATEAMWTAMLAASPAPPSSPETEAAFCYEIASEITRLRGEAEAREVEIAALVESAREAQQLYVQADNEAQRLRGEVERLRQMIRSNITDLEYAEAYANAGSPRKADLTAAVEQNRAVLTSLQGE